MSALEILDAGPLTTVQDLGRHGWADAGVSPSGAADLELHRLANRLVGNDESAATLEVTAGGLRARASADLVVAVAGPEAEVTVDGREVGTMRSVRVDRDRELRVGRPHHGLRHLLAVRGGIDVPPVLGSRSTDVLCGLGPPRLSSGDRLDVGDLVVGPVPAVDVAPWRYPVGPVELVPGPRDDHLTPAARTTLRTAVWTVASDTDRVAVRLRGPALASTDPGREHPSEGLVRGAVQVPPDGQPIVFLADHPVTGGYPTVAVVAEAHLGRLAQLAPGVTVSFRERPASH